MTVTFADDFVAMARRNVNAHHADDVLAISRNLGAVPDAEHAEVTGIDGNGLHIEATVGGQAKALHVPFLEPVAEPGQVRVAVVNLAREARGPRNAV